MAKRVASKSRAPRRPYVRFTRWRRAHFFRVPEETGHAQMAAAAEADRRLDGRRTEMGHD